MITVADTLYFRLRAARQAAGLSQQDVGRHLGVTGAAISRWENGHRSIDPDELVKLARLYGTTVGWLVGESPFFSPETTGEDPHPANGAGER